MSTTRNQVAEIKRSIKRKSWFFGIGIDDYVEFPKLQNAVRDVDTVLDLMLEHYDVEMDTTIMLLNEEATEENIIDKFDFLATNLGPEDKLMIYYSGHGHLNTNTELGYWIPVDAKKGKSSRYVLNSTIRDYIKAIDAKHVLLISDSCFSGSLLTRSSASDVMYNQLDERASRWAICSGRHDEKVYDGKPGGHSPFAESILDALKLNKQGLFNVGKLADMVLEQTRMNYDQLPEGRPLYGVGDKGGQYIFRKKGNEAAWSPKSDKRVVPTTKDEAKVDTRSESKPKSKTKQRKQKSQISTSDSSSTMKMVLAGIAIFMVGMAAIFYFAFRGTGASDSPAFTFSHEMKNGNLTVTAGGGVAPYKIEIRKDGKLKLQQSLTQPGSTLINLNPVATRGAHQLVLTDATDKSISQDFDISMLGAASNSELSTEPTTNLTNSGSDKQVPYLTKDFNGLTWLRENLMEQSTGKGWYLHNDYKTAFMQGYGSLYDYEAAEKACQELGTGWRLPTTEDWLDMARAYGGMRTESAQSNMFIGNKELGEKLVMGGESGLDLILGGNYIISSSEFSPKTADKGITEGHYWTKGKRVFSIRNLGQGEIIPDMTKNAVSWPHAYSCRCVKD